MLRCVDSTYPQELWNFSNCFLSCTLSLFCLECWFNCFWLYHSLISVFVSLGLAHRVRPTFLSLNLLKSLYHCQIFHFRLLSLLPSAIAPATWHLTHRFPYLPKEVYCSSVVWRMGNVVRPLKYKIIISTTWARYLISETFNSLSTERGWGGGLLIT